MAFPSIFGGYLDMWDASEIEALEIDGEVPTLESAEAALRFIPYAAAFCANLESSSDSQNEFAASVAAGQIPSICPVCTLPAEDNCVECSKCCNWFHFRCALGDVDYGAIDFTCGCRDAKKQKKR